MFALILTQLRHRLAAGFVLALLATSTVAAGVAVPLYTAAAREHTVSAHFANASAADRGITVTTELPASGGAASALEKLAADVLRHTGEVPLQMITGVAIEGGAVPPDTAGAMSGGGGHGSADVAAAPLSVALVARNGFCERLRIDGRCPSAAGEVVVSEATAVRLGRAGSIGYRPAGLDAPMWLTVVGVYHPAPEAAWDVFWAGRAGLVPVPLREANPILTQLPTIQQSDVDTVTGMVDLVVAGPAWPADRLDELAVDLGPLSTDDGYDVNNGLPRLLSGIESAQQRLSLSAPLGAVTMLLLSLWTLLLAAARLAQGQRSEVALAALRGTPGRHHFLLARGAAVLVVLPAGVSGIGLGWLLVRVVAGLAWAPSEPVRLTGEALVWGAAVVVVAMLAVSLVDGGVRSGSLLESFRRVPPRHGRTGLVFEAVVVALAMAAVGQVIVSGGLGGEPGTGAGWSGGLAVAAPILVAAVIGLAATRLVRPLASVVGQARLYRGRLGSALTALQLSRRAGAAQAVTLVVVSLALTGYAVAGWHHLSVAAADQAIAGLGAPRVVEVAAPTRSVLLAAVRAADPRAQWAVAAARERLPQGPELVALDTARLGSTLDWPAMGELRPAANGPLLVDGAHLVLDVTVTQAVTPIVITAALTGPDGAPVVVTATIPAEPGRRDYRMAVPQCARPPGCRLAWLSFPRSPDELRLHGISQLGPDRGVVTGAAMASPGRFRPSFEQEHEVTLHGEDGYLTVRYRPSDPRRLSQDIRLQVADAPVPVPVAVRADSSLLHTGEFRAAALLSAVARPVTVVSAGEVFPGVPDGGVLVDLVYADRVSDTFDNTARLQVWLGRHAPPDALDRLSAAGLVALRTESASDLAARLRLSPDALGLRLQLLAAVLSTLLAGLAIVLFSAADQAERAAELAALHGQGVPTRVVRQVAHRGLLAVVVASLPPALLASSMIWWLGGVPPSWPVVAALAGGVLVLATAARYADHRLWRAVGVDGQAGS